MLESSPAPQSPQLAALQAELAAGNSRALDAFWIRLAAHGTPLIEPLEDDPTSSLVTIVFRAPERCGNVLLLSALAPTGHDELLRLADTDLWYRTYTVRNDTRTVYSLLPDQPMIDWLRLPLAEAEARLSAQATLAQPDPLNPKVFDSRLPLPGGARMPLASLLEMPGAPPQEWIERRQDVARGEVKSHRLDSTHMGSAQIVWTYTPPGYAEDSEPCGLLILFDGYVYTHTIDTPAILDNMIAMSRVRPLVTAFVQGGDRLSELLCNPLYARFVAEELVPWVRERFNVSSDPAATIIGGLSAGGLAASYMALTRPDLFGNVLSQSGSYWWRPEDDPEHEWLTRQYAQSPRQSLRFYLDVGLLERVPSHGNGPHQIFANRHFRDVLQARGYAVSYQEFAGGHDYVCWRGTLSDGLRTLAGT